jgi:hypothetical protein
MEPAVTIASIVETDNGDGTGLRTFLDAARNVVSTEEITGLPIPVEEVTITDVVAALREPLANLTTSSTSTTVRTALLGLRSALDEFIAP